MASGGGATAEERGHEAADEGGDSAERAVRCPRCGGEFARRAIRGNPFLSKSGAYVACSDCGLDCHAVAVYRLADPW